MWILALDVGTSSIRAIGYDALGRPLPGADARVSSEPTATPDGGFELDPEELVAATASAIDRCVASAAGPPAAVGASVFWHSLLALDADGRLLTGVITWADTRSAGAAKALRARLDETAVDLRTGAPLHSTFFPAKLTWLREARPTSSRARPRGAASPNTCCCASPAACARASAWQRAGAWDTGMLDGCGIGPGRLPPIDDAPLIGLAPEWRARWPALADALGVPIEVREGTEASSRGAALLALGALGRPAPPPEPSGTQVRPDPRRRDIYAAARARQGRLYDSVVGPRVS
jgi:gluconokinase